MKTNPFFKNNKNNKNRNMDPKEKENIDRKSTRLNSSHS